MAEQMKSKAHVLALYRAAKDLGIDATQLTAENPFSKSGSTAAMIQEVIQQNDAVLAAEMRQAAGIGPNLAAVAQMMSGGLGALQNRPSPLGTPPFTSSLK